MYHQGQGQFHFINSNSFQFNLINSNSIHIFYNIFFQFQFQLKSFNSNPIQFKINSIGVFPLQTHDIIAICNLLFFGNSNKELFSKVIVIEELFSKVIIIEDLFSKVVVIDPKVIDNSLLLFYYIYCCKLIKYQVCLHVIPTASNCVQIMAELLFIQTA